MKINTLLNTMTTTTISLGSPGWLSDNSWFWKYITRGLHRTLQSLSAIHNIYRESYNLVKLSISAGLTHTSSSSSSYEWESPTSLIETVTIAMWGVRWLVSDGGPQYWHQSDLCCENSASKLDGRGERRPGLQILSRLESEQEMTHRDSLPSTKLWFVLQLQTSFFRLIQHLLIEC